MAHLSISFFGAALGKASRMQVLFPDTGAGPFPVLYLLHGLSDDDTAWWRYTSLERYVSNWPMILVMPDAGRSWYSDAASRPGLAYESHMIRDVVGFVDRTFPTLRQARSRGLGGLSMGGYGAVKLALKYPELFSAASSHSGALLLGTQVPLTNPDEQTREVQAELEAIMGSHPQNQLNDCSVLATLVTPEKRPALWIDCGTEDFLLLENRLFHQKLLALGYEHHYAEYPGSHSWDYWDKHLPEALEFHRRQLAAG